MSAALEASYIPELEQEVLGALLVSGDVKYLPGSLEPGTSSSRCTAKSSPA